MRTSCMPKRTAPPCCISTATWCTKSPARRRSKACARPAASRGASAQSWRRPTTTRRPPTGTRHDGIADPISRLQVETLDKNIEEFGADAYFTMHDKRQGIVHVIGPEQGATLPGMTVVCGDSHTSHPRRLRLPGARHRHLGSRARAGHADACWRRRPRPCWCRSTARCRAGVTAKDIVLAMIGKIGTAGGTGYAIEFARLDHPRAVDGRPHDRVQHGHRSGRARRHGRRRRHDHRLRQGPAVRADGSAVGTGGRLLAHAAVATRARSSTRSSSSTPPTISPQVTWGTSPEMVMAIDGRVPDPDKEKDADQARRDRSARWPTWA